MGYINIVISKKQRVIAPVFPWWFQPAPTREKDHVKHLHKCLYVVFRYCLWYHLRKQLGYCRSLETGILKKGNLRK